MKKSILVFIKQASKPRLFLIFGIGFITAYFLLIHTELMSWYALREKNIQLNSSLQELKSKPELSNPLQHDPLIHNLIKIAQRHQLEITKTQFNKAQQGSESCSCEVEGTYLNTENFIKDLFSSSFALNLRELRMHAENRSTRIKSQLVLDHEL